MNFKKSIAIPGKVFTQVQSGKIIKDNMQEVVGVPLILWFLDEIWRGQLVPLEGRVAKNIHRSQMRTKSPHIRQAQLNSIGPARRFFREDTRFFCVRLQSLEKKTIPL